MTMYDENGSDDATTIVASDIAALREQNLRERERLQQDMLAREIESAASESASSRWRAQAGERAEQHDRERAARRQQRECTIVHKAATTNDDIDARIAAAIEAEHAHLGEIIAGVVAAERARHHDILAGLTAAIRAEGQRAVVDLREIAAARAEMIDDLIARVDSLRIQVADLQGDLDRLRHQRATDSTPQGVESPRRLN
jgi:hypothetical protein